MRNSEQKSSSDLIVSAFEIPSAPLQNGAKTGRGAGFCFDAEVLTPVDFHVRQSLPFVHRYGPGGVVVALLLPTATEVDDQFRAVPAQSIE